MRHVGSRGYESPMVGWHCQGALRFPKNRWLTGETQQLLELTTGTNWKKQYINDIVRHDIWFDMTRNIQYSNSIRLVGSMYTLIPLWGIVAHLWLFCWSLSPIYPSRCLCLLRFFCAQVSPAAMVQSVGFGGFQLGYKVQPVPGGRWNHGKSC